MHCEYNAKINFLMNVQFAKRPTGFGGEMPMLIDLAILGLTLLAI
ncbi:MAG: hypothetical protein QW346_03255 [Candidatus Micrarchaeaceae archaeon]